MPSEIDFSGAAEVKCWQCGFLNRLWDPAPGKTVTCRKCGAKVAWPEPDPTPSTPSKHHDQPRTPNRARKVIWFLALAWFIFVGALSGNLLVDLLAGFVIAFALDRIFS